MYSIEDLVDDIIENELTPQQVDEFLDGVGDAISGFAKKAVKAAPGMIGAAASGLAGGAIQGALGKAGISGSGVDAIGGAVGKIAGNIAGGLAGGISKGIGDMFGGGAKTPQVAVGGDLNTPGGGVVAPGTTVDITTGASSPTPKQPVLGDPPKKTGQGTVLAPDKNQQAFNPNVKLY